MENYKQELDQLKKELNDRIDIAISKIDKPKFKTGKWHCYKHNPIFMGFYKNGFDNFGFNLDGWSNDIVMTIPDLWRLSTESEVKEALTKEAIKRGLVTGSYALFGSSAFIGANNFKRLITDTHYYLVAEVFFIGNDCLMTKDGVWAELYKPKSIDELSKEFAQFFFNSKDDELKMS